MGVKETKLTDEQFTFLRTTNLWEINEIPQEMWPKIPGIQRLHDTFSMMGSGNILPGTLNGQSAIGGIDVLCIEPRPKPTEPDGNAYHYIVQQRTDGKYLIGPYRRETIVPHWFEAGDLDKYWEEGP